MKNFRNLSKSVAVLVVFLLVLAACATEADEANAPVNDDPTSNPISEATCIADEPDCNDMGVTGDTPQDLPDDGEGVVLSPSSGMPANGGLTISEASASSATGVLGVQGYLVDDGSSARFCEALAESYPPQCGGNSIVITGYDEVVGPLTSEQGITWTDEPFVVFGEIVDGVLVVDPTVSG